MTVRKKYQFPDTYLGHSYCFNFKYEYLNLFNVKYMYTKEKNILILKNISLFFI